MKKMHLFLAKISYKINVLLLLMNLLIFTLEDVSSYHSLNNVISAKTLTRRLR